MELMKLDLLMLYIRELRDEVEALKERVQRNLKERTIKILMDGRG